MEPEERVQCQTAWLTEKMHSFEKRKEICQAKKATIQKAIYKIMHLTEEVVQLFTAYYDSSSAVSFQVSATSTQAETIQWGSHPWMTAAFYWYLTEPDLSIYAAVIKTRYMCI